MWKKLSPKESVKVAITVLRGSVRAPEGFSEGKPEATKPRGAAPKVLQTRGNCNCVNYKCVNLKDVKI